MSRIILFILMLLSSHVAAAHLQEKNYFQFEVANYHTQRQSGQTLNLYVRYAYKARLAASKYVDYRKMRTKAMNYLEPSEQFPKNTYWEILATEIGHQLLKSYPLEAISVQIEVLDNAAGGEPGNHGSVFTAGDILPLDVHQPLYMTKKFCHSRAGGNDRIFLSCTECLQLFSSIDFLFLTLTSNLPSLGSSCQNA